ncbi:MAG: hypothetical protein DLM50_02130 [Candidatus Meridianibacter frigidus]|nr:MAG: hypothetical protein DLM50_02130 [Candidatus Eremiobacteraeota bacterium]
MLNLIWAVASIGTFFVFVISAVVALGQFRSNSRSNQLAGLQAVSAHSTGTDFQRWFAFVLKELPIKMADPAFRDGLRENPIDRDAHPEIQLADWYEEVGILAKYGVVHEAPLIELLRGGPETAWRALGTTIALYREIWGFSYYRNFERLAERSRAFYSKIDPERTAR